MSQNQKNLKGEIKKIIWLTRNQTMARKYDNLPNNTGENKEDPHTEVKTLAFSQAAPLTVIEKGEEING